MLLLRVSAISKLVNIVKVVYFAILTKNVVFVSSSLGMTLPVIRVHRVQLEADLGALHFLLDFVCFYL